MKKFAVVLSGCGVFDGAEIHESVMALWAIRSKGHEYQVFAPDIPHAQVVDHLTGKNLPNQRSVLSEAARIARGNILPLSRFDAAKFDALLFPGGFGVAKNLCDFALKGTDCSVQPDVRNAIRAMHDACRPIGAVCMGPILLALVLGKGTLTLGGDSDASRAAEALGATHVATGPGHIVVDKARKWVTAPCYMNDTQIEYIARELDEVVDAMLQLIS